jgi:hypothetical protein
MELLAVSADILTEEDLLVISEAHTRPAMIAWLEANKIPYLIAKSGWPRVHRKAIERAMGVKLEDSQAHPVAFNFDNLK